MNARIFLVIFIVYTLALFAGAVWHYTVDVTLGGDVGNILYMFSAFLGIRGIWQSIVMGVRFGWKS